MRRLNIRKRGRVWEYYFEIGGAGKRERISKSGFHTFNEAQTAGQKAMLSKRTIRNIHLREFLEQYIEYAQHQLRPNTVKTYENNVRVHILPELGNPALEDITTFRLQKMMNKFHTRATALSVRYTLSSAFRYAVRMGFISSNPMENVTVPRFENVLINEKKILSPSDFEVIYDRLKDTCYGLMVAIGWYCGLRIGETLGLTWDDIDLNKEIVRVRRQLSKVDNKWCLALPKSNTSIRDIPFGERLKELFKKEKRYSVKYDFRNGELVKSDRGSFDFVCRQENGNLITTDTERSCARMIRKIYPDYSYHLLRHSHASLLADLGVPAKTLQVRLGHSSVRTTLQYYIHPLSDAQNEAAEKFDQIQI